MQAGGGLQMFAAEGKQGSCTNQLHATVVALCAPARGF